MKKRIILITAFLLMAVVGVVNAKSKVTEDITAELVLQDGTKVSGKLLDYDETGIYFAMHEFKIYNIKSVTIGASTGGKGVKYDADKAKSLKLTNKGESVEYLSLYAVKNLTFPRNLRARSHRTFWRVIYKGKNVLGFGSYAQSNYTTMPGHHVTEQSYAYSYCLKDDDVTVTYLIPEQGIVVGLKSTIRLCFERFPKMTEYLQSKDFSLKAAVNDPLSLLKVLENKVK